MVDQRSQLVLLPKPPREETVSEPLPVSFVSRDQTLVALRSHVVPVGIHLGIVVTIHKIYFSKHYLFFCFQHMNYISLSFRYLFVSVSVL